MIAVFLITSFLAWTVGFICAWVYLSKYADELLQSRKEVPRHFPDITPTFEPSGHYEPDGTETLKTSENGLKTVENAVKTDRYCREVPVDPETWGAVTVKKGYEKMPLGGFQDDHNQIPLFV